jgi:hypothetical protein
MTAGTVVISSRVRVFILGARASAASPCPPQRLADEMSAGLEKCVQHRFTSLGKVDALMRYGDGCGSVRLRAAVLTVCCHLLVKCARPDITLRSTRKQAARILLHVAKFKNQKIVMLAGRISNLIFASLCLRCEAYPHRRIDSGGRGRDADEICEADLNERRAPSCLLRWRRKFPVWAAGGGSGVWRRLCC